MGSYPPQVLQEHIYPAYRPHKQHIFEVVWNVAETSSVALKKTNAVEYSEVKYFLLRSRVVEIMKKHI